MEGHLQSLESETKQDAITSFFSNGTSVMLLFLVQIQAFVD